MKIPLPKNYSYKDYVAFVIDDILYIENISFYRAIMYDITYTLNECKECFYCHKPLIRDSSTLDHMYPVNLGGPTIPNNLTFSCSDCNSTKANLTADEFLFYLSLPEDEKNLYLRKTISERHEIKKWYSPYLPKNWYSMEPISKICTDYLDSVDTSTKSYRKTKRDYKKYGRFIKPIIVDRNFVVIHGINTLAYAINNSIEKAPTIVLENVEFMVYK